MKTFVLCLSLLLAIPASAAIKVVTSLPDFAWAARQIGGERVEVDALLRGTENPHFADAVPEFIRLVSNADVVCQAGLELEVGWLPKVLARSGNARVQPGGRGSCELGKGIEAMEKPAGAVNRSMGDVHPLGNPHFWTSPKAFAQASKQIVDALTRVDPEGADAYRKGGEALAKKLDEIFERNRRKLAPLVDKATGPQLIEYHGELVYYLAAYGLKSLGRVEEKPGQLPSAGRIAEVAAQAKAAHVKLALAADFSPLKTLERFRELSGVPLLVVPVSVQPRGRIKEYGELQDFITDELVKLLKAPGAPPR